MIQKLFTRATTWGALHLFHRPEHAGVEWKWHSENLFIIPAQAETWANIQLQWISWEKSTS